MSYPVIPCAHCNQPGHKANRCKQLGIPPDGEIIKPLPGQNDVDEEDDSIAIPGIKTTYLKLLGQKRNHNQTQNTKNKKQKPINTPCLAFNKRAEP